MEKVERDQSPKRAKRDWSAEADTLTDKDALRMLWQEAKAAGADQKTLEKVKARAGVIEDTAGQPPGAAGSVRRSGAKK